MLSFLFFAVICLLCKASPKPIILRDNNLGKREELTCHEEDTGCTLICLPLRCRNLNFKAAKVQPTSIRCSEDLSCIGELQIEGHLEGSLLRRKSSTNIVENEYHKYKRTSSVSIECLANHACHGGTYAFANAANAKFIGHAKESSIIFNVRMRIYILQTSLLIYETIQKIHSVQVSLGALFNENSDIKERFVMNHIFTHKVGKMEIIADTDHS